MDANASNSGMVSGTTNYIYDGNGNMLSATNTINTAQNKSFSYNLLNLPKVATVPNGTATYTYDAAGTKWRKVDVLGGVTTNTDYISGIQYDGPAPDTLDFIQTEEGKAVRHGSTYEYLYYLGDNLGNTRVTFGTAAGIASVYQKDDYYPFGLEINRAPSTPKNEYLYNKKELQEESAEYDYSARYYDPVIGRWNAIDPQAETSRRWSPYDYVEDAPIRLTDPDGMQATDDPKKKKKKKDPNKPDIGATTTTITDKQVVPYSNLFIDSKVTVTHAIVTGKEGGNLTLNSNVEQGQKISGDVTKKVGSASVTIGTDGVSIGRDINGTTASVGVTKDGTTTSLSRTEEGSKGSINTTVAFSFKPTKFDLAATRLIAATGAAFAQPETAVADVKVAIQSIGTIIQGLKMAF